LDWYIIHNEAMAMSSREQRQADLVAPLT
jgi:hypothetical protein